MDGSSDEEPIDDSFFRLSTDLLAVTEETLAFVKLNPAWSAQLGYPEGSLERRSLLDVIAPRDRDRVVNTLVGSLQSATGRTFDAGLLTTGQRVRQAHFTAVPSPDRDRFYLVARDITVRQRLERELASAQKLEAIGQLASGIAHEINTPIQFVGDNLSFLGDSFVKALPLFEYLLSLDPKASADHPVLARLSALVTAAELEFTVTEAPLSISSACEGVERVAGLIKSLREFAHPDSRHMESADLNRAVKTTIAVARSEWRYVADVVTDLGEIPPVPCHLSAINQVLLNLLCNASHAIADTQKKPGSPKGTIRVATRSDGHFLTISVQDSGTGIPLAVRPRIFDPFYTTKEVGRGTGQGLAIARTIVCEKHHGRLDFETEEGVGTTFFIRLPLEQEVEGGGEP